MLNKNLKKIDIIENLSKKTGFTKRFSKKIIEDLIEIFLSNIKKGNFNLKNIGSFNIIDKKERVGRNPKTKKEYKISSRKSISFKVSGKLNNELNKYL